VLATRMAELACLLQHADQTPSQGIAVKLLREGLTQAGLIRVPAAEGSPGQLTALCLGRFHCLRTQLQSRMLKACIDGGMAWVRACCTSLPPCPFMVLTGTVPGPLQELALEVAQQLTPVYELLYPKCAAGIVVTTRASCPCGPCALQGV
jgi:hypothetical protein